jgi:hypothetical protein
VLEDVRPIAAKAWIPDGEIALCQLYDLVTSSERILPVIVLSEVPGASIEGYRVGRFLLNHETLARNLVGIAHVVALDQKHTLAWTAQMGDSRWSVFHGAVRVYRAGLSLERDAPWDHPLTIAKRVLASRAADLRGESAFEHVLEAELRRDAVLRRMDWGSLPFVPEARLRKATAARKGVSEFSEWKNLYEEEVTQLNGRIRELESDIADFDAISDAYRRERDVFARETHNLRAQLDTLRESIKSRTGGSADLDVPHLSSYDEIPEWIEKHYSDRAVLHPRAHRALKSAKFADLELVENGLRLLATTYRDMRRGVPDTKTEFDKRLAELCLALGGSITRERAGEQGDTYFVRYPIGSEQRRFLEFHLRRGTSRDERNCLAIYFFWDEENEKVVIGWLPSHLENRKT